MTVLSYMCLIELEHSKVADCRKPVKAVWAQLFLHS